MWRGVSMDRAHDAPAKWAGHYSGKYESCYVVLEFRFPVRDGAAPLVSELWDAFDATVLAAWTGDERVPVRRRFCQVALSDDPYTSCAVSKYFIDEHMAH